MSAFATTHWSIVLAAQGADEPIASRALETLFRTYQRPLIAHLRRWGRVHHDAEDLLQSFFEHVLRTGALRTVDRSRGRLRSFLLKSLENFARHDHEASQAAKRGGGATQIGLEIAADDPSMADALAANPTTDRHFDREWAHTLIDNALSRLEQEFVADAKSRQFSALVPFLSRPPAPGEYERVAESIGVKASLMPTLVSRLRGRYRDLVRAEVAATVSTTAEVDAELTYLVELLLL